MRDRSEWTRGPDGEHRINGRKYKDLVQFSRPCVTCSKPFSIFVTKKVADGLADSNNFGLKNCEDHRRNHTAVQPELAKEITQANATMKQELDGLYARLTDLFNENQKLKAELAQYRLQDTMKAHAKKFPWGS